MDRYRHPRTKGLTPMMVIEPFAPHGTLNAERRHRLGQWLITEVMRTDSAPAATTAWNTEARPPNSAATRLSESILASAW